MTVSHDDSSFDFNKLERELKAAVAADEKYTRENDAKFRAVRQKVGSYDEFRDIVLASHLKPLEKEDKIDGKFVQPWNTHADIQKHKKNVQSSQSEQEMKHLPQNNQEFVREWRKLSLENRYKLLLQLGGQRLENIFKAEIGFGLLGEFIPALVLCTSEECDSVLEILASLSRTNRFSLSVQFMSSKEKDVCGKLFEHLETEKLSERFLSLRTLYGIK